MKYVIMLLAILSVPAIASSKTIHVPGDCNTIQEAIDAAAAGDEVLVAPGTYMENIGFKGKAVAVRSDQGPEATVIDGDRRGSVAAFWQGEGPDSILEGFTITNGSGTYYAPFLVECGGGVFCSYASPSLIHNRFEKNSVPGRGGGLVCNSYNNAQNRPWIIDNAFLGNTSGEDGGGIVLAYCKPLFFNNILAGNTAANAGGGMLCTFAVVNITNNTLAGNSTYSMYGGALFISNGCAVDITNTILWQNDTPGGAAVWLFPGKYGSALIISYSDLEGGKASVMEIPGGTFIWGAGMIDADPLFVDPMQGDFHIFHDSPCRNAGNNAVPELPGEDFEGDPRIAFGTVDMGADEFHTHLHYTGDTVPKGMMNLTFIGVPGTTPVALFIGSGVLDPSWPTPWGEWHLAFPVAGPIDLGMIPTPGGVLHFSGTLPPTPPGPYTVPMQALIGGELTNLCLMKVK